MGHYRGAPREWFVVWAKDREEAFLEIDPIVAEPDMDSLMELRAPGFVNFTVRYDKEEERVRFWPPKRDVKEDYWLVFGGAFGKDDNVEEYVLQRLEKKRLHERPKDKSDKDELKRKVRRQILGEA
ncbi:MAG: hypothetical protein QW587_05565 [Candidatus Bathyarchaeia archaeon]